ncbi:MAG: polyprenyl synthetase family protein [Lentimicrobium sp.]|jgi:geranylgeranyl diphosphate synthase type II|nr:polyprenyl synthetase family protein [Lentimicrobium sp.]
MLTSDQLQEKIKEAIDNLPVFGQPEGLYQPIAYTLKQGGKRLRPLLALLSTQAFDGNPDEALPAAIAIEIFHNFTLLHDDIIDEAPLRRGNETVYKKWNINTAILSGDTMFAIAYGQLSGSAPRYIPELMQVFTQTAIEVCEGQQYDIDFETSGSVNIQGYLNMIRLKTAVLLAASLKIGAIIGNASSEDCEKIYHFGENLGIAFQLQDDLLDAFGNESVFGKKTGGDILTNKKTFLYLRALECSSKEDAARLKELYAQRDMKDEEKINNVLELFRKADIEKRTDALIIDYFNKAMEQMHQISLPESNKSALIALASSMLKRKH